jgi:hypothetical protein
MHNKEDLTATMGTNFQIRICETDTFGYNDESNTLPKIVVVKETLRAWKGLPRLKWFQMPRGGNQPSPPTFSLNTEGTSLHPQSRPEPSISTNFTAEDRQNLEFWRRDDAHQTWRVHSGNKHMLCQIPQRHRIVTQADRKQPVDLDITDESLAAIGDQP